MSFAGLRIAVLGHGAIGAHVLNSLQKELAPGASIAVLGRRSGSDAPALEPSMRYFSAVEDLLAWRPQLAIECAGHAVVSEVVPGLLRRSVDVVITSVGALARDGLLETLNESAERGRARYLTVCGAIGGLDALAAACRAGPVSVTYTGRKPARAWDGTPAQERFDLAGLREATVIFEGPASEAAALFPKNANVTAAVALAGVGFEETRVRLIAEPDGTSNVHELDVVGAFGSFGIRLENRPLPSNPKTSFLAALSVDATVRQYLLDRR